MRAGLVIAIAGCAACGGGEPAEPPPKAPPSPMPVAIAQLEEKLGAPYDGLAIAREGVYLARRRAGWVGELETSVILREELVAGLTWQRAAVAPRKQINGIKDPEGVAARLLVVPDVSAWHVTRAIEVVSRSTWDNLDVLTIADGSPVTVCRLRWRDTRPDAGDSDRVTLSVLVGPEKITFGISRVNEFEVVRHRQGAPDFARVGELVAEYKKSAFFADRTDIQIAADASVTATELLQVLAVACREFTGAVVVLPEALAAQPPT